HEAGYGRYSFISTVAGVLTAFGLFAVAGAIVASIVRGRVGDEVSQLDWRTLSIGTGAVVVGVLFLGHLLGGYVAGRMARRSGPLNGLAVFVGSLLLAGVAGLITRLADENASDHITANLRSVGVPTAAVEWQQIATIAAG